MINTLDKSALTAINTNTALLEVMCEAGVDYNQSVLIASGFKPPFAYNRVLLRRDVPSEREVLYTDEEYGKLVPCDGTKTSPGCVVVEYIDQEGAQFYLHLIEDGKFLGGVVSPREWSAISAESEALMRSYLVERLTLSTHSGKAAATLYALFHKEGIGINTALAYHCVDFYRDNPDLQSDFVTLFRSALESTAPTGRSFYCDLVSIGSDGDTIWV